MKKHNIPLNILPIMAAVNVAAHLALKVVEKGQVAPAESGDAVIGYSGSLDVKAGFAVDVVTAGVIPVVFEQEVTAGQRVGLSSAGKLMPASDPTTAIGVAAQDCSAGDVGSIYRI